MNDPLQLCLNGFLEETFYWYMKSYDLQQFLWLRTMSQMIANG